MDCPKCGTPIDQGAGPHRCAYTLNAAPGHIAITGLPIGMVVEGRPEASEGHRVDARPASGGTALSQTDEVGGFRVEMSGELDKGPANERHALAVLVEALRAIGRDASPIQGARDDAGEDGALMLDGARVAVQVVSVPVDPSVWRTLSKSGQVNASGTINDAVAMVRSALEHKRGKAAGTLLLLDAAHIGALVGPALVEAYRTLHGDPGREFCLVEAWLVGPTTRSVFRLGSEGAGQAD